MNIILKAFDSRFSKQTLERALRDVKIGTCISVMNHTREMPELDVKEHIWISAKQQRAGQYPDIRWPEITPLDEELIESMRHCEAVFLTMVERYARYRDMPYEERKRQYFDHLRYWNHILDTKDIGLLLMNTAPHQCYDLVIYDLCKLKKIPVLYIERLVHFGTFTLEEDWEYAGKEIQNRFVELQKEYADAAKPIPLSASFERFFHMYSDVDVGPWYMGPRDKHLEHRSFLRKWCNTAMRIAVRKPYYFFRSVFSSACWRRKWYQHTTANMYDRLTKIPDLTQPYIYVPLHMQPEATTCPLAGAFTDQELMVHLLASCLLPDIRLFIKEHPAQGELCRSKRFYEALHKIPSVTLVPRHYDSFQLIRHALAVSTATGTAILEGLFRGKPAIMFGHQYFQFAPGVFRIRTKEECQHAVRRIVQQEGLPSLHDMRLFMKAIEDSSTLYAGAVPDPHVSFSLEERAVMMGEVIADRVQSLL